MFDAKKLWRQRLQLYIKEMRRYLRLIFNDHFKFVLIFAVGAGAFYYQKWLETLSPQFPALFLITIVIALVLTQSPIQTFLKEADLVFLLPLETKLKTYFNMSIIYSYIVQCYVLFLVFAVVSPLYLHQKGSSFEHLILVGIILLVVKAWNIWVSWKMGYFLEPFVRYSDFVVRLSINFLFTYFLLNQGNFIYPMFLGLVMVLLWFYFSKQTSKNKTLKWEKLIELESQRMMMFYRIANLFTDVPKLKGRVKRRRYLDWLTRNLQFSKKFTYDYLFLKTFIRSSDYFGVYTRLIVIGSVVLYLLPIYYGQLFVVLLFLYLGGFQLLPLWRHHVTKLWVDLYPVSIKEKKQSFLRNIFKIMVFKVFVFTVIVWLLSGWQLGIFTLIISMIFNYVFVYVYAKNRVEKIADQV